MNALSGSAGLFQRNATHRRFGFFLDVRFAIGIAAPPCKREALFDGLLELLVVGRLGGIGLAKRKRAIEKRLLNLVEHLNYRRRNTLLRDE